MRAIVVLWNQAAIAITGDELRRVLMLLASGRAIESISGMDMGTLYNLDALSNEEAKNLIKSSLWSDTV